MSEETFGIEVKKPHSGEGYEARVIGKPGVWGYGKTAAEAIGGCFITAASFDLVRYHTDVPGEQCAACRKPFSVPSPGCQVAFHPRR